MQVRERRRYRVLDILGKGGFGTVYRAEMLGENGFARQVALKILNPALEGESEYAPRLRDEARMLGLLRHRAIVQVDALLRLDGRWAAVMEYVQGADLNELLDRTPVPTGIALDIIQEVAGALHVAYDGAGDEGAPLRVLHRDIKPANIQLTRAGEVKVLDFGVARAEFASRESRTRRLFFGSLPYMAPERIEFEDGHAGDVYALGALLYELLTGTRFGETTSDEEEHEEKLEAALHRLRRFVPSDRVRRLVARMLTYEPEDRPSAKEVERSMRALRQRFGAPWLSDWAEERVGELLDEKLRERDALCGRVLAEPSPAAKTRAPPTIPHEIGAHGDRGWTIAALVGAGGAGVVFALFVGLLLVVDFPTPSALRPVSWVSLDGGAEDVSLISERGEFPLGWVPEGVYRVRAVFSDGAAVEAGAIEIDGGEEVVLHCNRQARTCEARP